MSGEKPPAPRRYVLMGDPSHFSVIGGANPHTRTRWGTRRRVDRERAIRQWQDLKSVLESLGIGVVVVPPDPAQPGLVYPANAGFLLRVDEPLPLAKKEFYLANLLPTRVGEKPHYARVLKQLGIPVRRLEERFRMEGEADFFPAGAVYLLTWGGLQAQRFVPALRLPPWRRVYGFRTDAGAADALIPIVRPKRVIPVELQLETHYHGDTVLCAFGPGRRYLLAYRQGIGATVWEPLRVLFGEHLIPLSEEDAARYAANSFTYTPSGQEGSDPESFLVMPEGVSDALLGQVRDRGVTPVRVDISEFLKKGGGSVKCMIGDLGPVVASPPTEVPESPPL